MFRRGVFPGAVTGGVIGLAPGVLLVLVMSGGSYHVGAAEVLGFIIMCVTAAALLGAALGGVFAVVAGSLWRGLRSRLAGRG